MANRELFLFSEASFCEEVSFQNGMFSFPGLQGVFSFILVDDGSKQPDDSSSDSSNSEKFSSCRYDVMIKIKHHLTAGIRSLKTISVVGMGGIGKTTLAQSIYEDTEITHHFHVRAWVTISQEYELRNVFLRLLKSMDSLPSEVPELGDEYFLAEMLYRCLKERRYLIVLDDIWSRRTWNELKGIFPNDNNGSRIILTTRDAEVAACADLDTPHCLECLSIDESWRLLCNKLFVGKPCPPDLKEIGKEIAKGCQGLPLAIVVVAGHLSKIGMNRDCWADVAKGLASILTRNQKPAVLDILCLSYDPLPQHLKACFLYMGVFPQNSEIPITKLIRLWCSAGFLSAEFPESIEDKAEKCMEELISRNLITVKEKKYDGTAKTCGIHDLLWDLCLRQGRREGHCIFGRSDFWRQPHSTSPQYLMGRLTSSYLYCDSPDRWSCFLNSDCFGLLKNLDIHFLCFHHFPDEVTQIVSLRYLELATCANIPATISMLCNLETLINNHKSAGPILPEEIWLLKRLRHLHIGTCTFLPNTPEPNSDGSSSVSILPHLQTLSTISFASCTNEIFSSIPNLKQLKIHEMGEEDDHLFDCLNNLSCLCQLENLKVNFSTDMRRQGQNLLRDTFPPSIKKLTLRGSHLPWEDMDIVAMLPNLEVLKLKGNAFTGAVYEQTLEFSRLKFLLFENLDLEQWIAETIHFPVLQHLVVKFCESLQQIPSCFGEIPTLESIGLYACSRSANDSARIVRREQWDNGNDDFRAHIEERAMLLDGRFFGAKITEKTIQAVSGLPEVASIAVDTGRRVMMLTGVKDPVQIARRLEVLCRAQIEAVGTSKGLDADEEEVELV